MFFITNHSKHDCIKPLVYAELTEILLLRSWELCWDLIQVGNTHTQTLVCSSVKWSERNDTKQKARTKGAQEKKTMVSVLTFTYIEGKKTEFLSVQSLPNLTHDQRYKNHSLGLRSELGKNLAAPSWLCSLWSVLKTSSSLRWRLFLLIKRKVFFT